MKKDGWVNIEFVKLIVRHFSGALAINVFFWLIAWISKHTMQEGLVLTIVELIDNIVIVASLIWLALVLLWELGLVIWGMVKDNGSTTSKLVA